MKRGGTLTPTELQRGDTSSAEPLYVAIARPVSDSIPAIGSSIMGAPFTPSGRAAAARDQSLGWSGRNQRRRLILVHPTGAPGGNLSNIEVGPHRPREFRRRRG